MNEYLYGNSITGVWKTWRSYYQLDCPCCFIDANGDEDNLHPPCPHHNPQMIKLWKDVERIFNGIEGDL